MGKYDPESICKKCGYDSIDELYESRSMNGVTEGESIVKTCRRCGFMWDEACLDGEGAGRQCEVQ